MNHKALTPLALLFVLFNIVLSGGCSESTGGTEAGTADSAVADAEIVDSGITADGQALPPDLTTGNDTTGPLQEPTAEDKATFDQLAAFATTAMQQGGVPGAAIAVVLPGKKPLLRGLGVKQKGQSDPVTEDTLFSLASVSKMFTAATVLALAEKNVMSTTDKAVQHLPALKVSDPHLGSMITVHELLAHTSGLGYADENEMYSAPVSWDSPDCMVQMFEKITWPMWSPPGAVWNYSNPAYSLAGATIMKASGSSFAQQVKDTILAPAGMASSTVLGDEAQTLDHSYGHGYGQTMPPGLDICGPCDHPSNGVYSSARDMAAFARMVLTGGQGVLSGASVTAMTSPQADMSFIADGDAYGYGWLIEDRQGVEILNHSGSNNGFTAHIILVPSEGFAVVVLMNSADGGPWEVAEKGAELFVDLPPLDYSGYQSTAQELAQLVGTYQEPFTLGGIQITQAAGGLSATFAKWSYTAALYQYGKRAFYMDVTGSMQSALEGMSYLDMAFYLDQASKGEYIVTLWGVAQRVSGP